MPTIVTIDRLPEIIAAFAAECSKAVEDAAQALIDSYSETTPVDSGLDKTSGYIVTKGKSTYGANASGVGELLPEVGKSADAFTAIAAVASSHAIYPEFGTRNQAAQPAFVPAVDVASGVLKSKLAELEKKLAPLGIPSI